MVLNKPISTYASIKHGYAFAGEYFSKEKQDYILLTPGNFHIDQRLYFGVNTKYYNGPIDDGYVLSNGDLLVVMTDLTKDMAILGNAVMLYSDVPVLHNQRIGLVETNEDVSKEYLCYLINSEHVRRHVKATASGTTVRHTSPSKMLNVKAYFPPLPEQQKIAKILSTCDKAISTTERLIENSTQQKKALMQQLLTGKKRLLDDDGNRFAGEWEEVKLGKISDVRDGTHDSPEFIDVGYPLITSKNLLSSGRLDLSNVKFISEEDYLQINKRSGVNDGDILFGMIGTIGNPVKVKSSNYAIKNVALIKETGGLLNGFLIYYLSSHDIDKQIHRLNAGGTQKFVALGVLRNLVIRLPTQQEQQQIATVLTNADKEIDLLEQQLADLQQEKKALMQVLLMGKKRVVVDE